MGAASAQPAQSGGRDPRITVTDIVPPEGLTVDLLPNAEIDAHGSALVGLSDGRHALWHRGAFEIFETPPEGAFPTGVNDLSDRRRVAAGLTNLASCPPFTCPVPAVWDDGQATILPTDGLYGSARWVNDRGTMVAGSLRNETPDGRRRELVGWVDGELVRGPAGADDDVIAMNNRGQALIIVPVDGTWHAAVWQVGGEVTDLGIPVGGDVGAPVDINERGEVAGWRTTPAGPRGFLWRDGEVVDLGPMEPADLNDRGQVVGLCITPDAPPSADTIYACLWDDGELIDLGDPRPAETGYVADDDDARVNNVGQVIAHVYVYPPDGGIEEHAHLWQDGQWIDLGAAAGFTGNAEPIDINDRGQVLGTLGERPVIWTVRH